jgi:hypothetical protein
MRDSDSWHSAFGRCGLKVETRLGECVSGGVQGRPAAATGAWHAWWDWKRTRGWEWECVGTCAGVERVRAASGPRRVPPVRPSMPARSAWLGCRRQVKGAGARGHAGLGAPVCCRCGSCACTGGWLPARNEAPAAQERSQRGSTACRAEAPGSFWKVLEAPAAAQTAPAAPGRRWAAAAGAVRLRRCGGGRETRAVGCWEAAGVVMLPPQRPPAAAVGCCEAHLCPGLLPCA